MYGLSGIEVSAGVGVAVGFGGGVSADFRDQRMPAGRCEQTRGDDRHDKPFHDDVPLSFQMVAVPTGPLNDVIRTAPRINSWNAACPSLKLDCRYVRQVMA